MQVAVGHEQTWAQQGRALLAGARTAVLRTGGSRSGGACASAVTVVEVADDGDGLPRVVLDGSSPAVAAIAACRVATLVVDAPTSPWRLRLVVSLRMGRPDADGRRTYDPILLSARLTGPRTVTVPVAEFLRAAPEAAPARDRRTLAHLEAAHDADLVTAARQHVPDLEDVVLLRVLGEHVEVAVLGPSGVDRLVLAGACACPA
jgi:hypothetical protein